MADTVNNNNEARLLGLRFAETVKPASIGVRYKSRLVA